MKKSNLVRALALAGLTLLPAASVTARTFTVLHSFTAIPFSTNSDGSRPLTLITNSSGNTLYGTTILGGSSGYGTVFAVNTDGTGFTNLHIFTGGSGGGQPRALILSGNTLYGTAGGTVFAVHTDGTGFTNLYRFSATSGDPATNSDGSGARGGLILSGNTLYGAAQRGGRFGNGTVFALNTDGTGFTNLHSFTATFDQTSYTNSDGSEPHGGLALSGNTLYGTTAGGGSFARGTVFAVHTDGTGFTNLHSCTPLSGVNPVGGGLILSGNTLYGTTGYGGEFDRGTLFALNTDGTGFTNLHSFIHSEGVDPRLILSGNILYGAAANGGIFGSGTIFAVHTNGTGFTNLHSFKYDDDGGGQPAGLVLSGHTLYGPAYSDGSFAQGTLFSLSFAPQLTILPSGANVILKWPTNVAGFDYTGFALQSTTNLVSPAVWSTNSPTPVIINGQNTVTNSASGTKMFYRLSR